MKRPKKDECINLLYEKDGYLGQLMSVFCNWKDYLNAVDHDFDNKFQKQFLSSHFKEVHWQNNIKTLTRRTATRNLKATNLEF